jgi:hypothetical protein
MMVQMQQEQQQIPTQTLTKPNPFPFHFKSEIAREKKTHPTPQQTTHSCKKEPNKQAQTN